MRPNPLIAACSLACLACDTLIGLDPPIARQGAVHNNGADSATEAARGDGGDAAPDVSPDVGSPADAATEASQDAIACTACASGCVDTMTDGLNCGGCGHTCLGATCSTGHCLPIPVVSGNPGNIAVDATNVYWTDGANGDLMKCPIAGCPAGGDVLFGGVASFSSYSNSVDGISVQGTQVFFAENETVGTMLGEVYVCPTSGCSGSAAPFATEAVWESQTGCIDNQGCMVGDVVTDATNVYWTSTSDQSVHYCPLAGCGGSKPAVLLPRSVNAYTPWGLAAAYGKLYLAIGGPFASVPYGVGVCSAAACTCPSGSCTLPSAGGTIPLATAIAAGTSGAYWTSNTNEVVANPIGTSSPAAASVLATVTAPGRVVVDADDVVYFTSGQPQAIYKCAASGCNGSPTVVLSGQGGIGEIQVDATRIYAVVGTASNQPIGNGGAPHAPTGTAIVSVAK